MSLDGKKGYDVRIVDYKEFEELRNQVEMLFGFLAGKKIMTATDIANILRESKKTIEEIEESNKKDLI